MDQTRLLSPQTIARDLTAGVVVFLVAVPLCLGIALASNAPLFSGLLAGIVGGILVGALSGSHTSVSGPAAGLTAVVYAQIASLGAFETFLLALVVAGVIQIGLGLARAGFIAAFFPSSVIKGLLAAIGTLLILKQIPHLLGRDVDPEGEMSFAQPDHETTFSELGRIWDGFHVGAGAVGLTCLILLVVWDRVRFLKKLPVPAPLVVVLLGVAISLYFRRLGAPWLIEPSHLVQVPVADSVAGFYQFIVLPDFSQWANPKVYLAGLTIAIVASLETLLNLEAVDKIDPKQRTSPPSRELFAQGVGNLSLGFIGGIPMTSVIVRSSVNINAGGQTKLSAIFHGVLLLVCVMFLPTYLNLIPLSTLAAVLIVTGVKLASPALIARMWRQGRYQFVPFAATLVSIVLTDLLIGVLIGLAISSAFILYSNARRPLRRIVERHLGGDVLHIELANQVSFLNRAALERILREAPTGSHVLLDATDTDYIDPDVLDLIRDFKEVVAPAHGVQVSLTGFRDRYRLVDEIQYADYSTRELQEKTTPAQVLQLLREGNERFRTGRRLSRDLGRQLNATARGQHPLAVVLSCIDSRTPAEIVFDLGLGDIFSVRIAGNVTSPKVLGSMEYGCAVVGAKLIVVMGHTQCGAVTAAVRFACSNQDPEQATGCQHLHPIVHEIQESMESVPCDQVERMSDDERADFIDGVAERNVLRTVQHILGDSRTLQKLVEEDRIAIVGAMYDVATGRIHFLTDRAVGLREPAEAEAAV